MKTTSIKADLIRLQRAITYEEEKDNNVLTMTNNDDDETDNETDNGQGMYSIINKKLM